MKLRKRIAFFSLIFGLTFLLTVDLSAWGWGDQPDGQRYRHRRHRHGGGGPVGAPLDGGLLALLAGGGIVYFTARKKRKDKE